MPPAVVEDPLGAKQLSAELRQALVLLRPAKLDRRAFRSGNARALECSERAVVRIAQRLQLDPLGRDALAHAAVAVAVLARVGDEAADRNVERGGEREAERAALVQQRRHGDLPALALLAEAVRDRHLDVAKEDLVELRLAGDLAQRAHLDAGRMHVDDEVREALVPRCARIAERDEDAVVGDVRERRPHLLAVDDVHVALALGARTCGGEVGACVRLRESLAPDFLRGEDLREVRLLLRVGAVRDDRRPRHTEPDDADVTGRLCERHLLVEDRLVAVRRTFAAVLLRPRQPGVARVIELATPLAAEVVAEALFATAPATPLFGHVRLEPGAQFGAELGLVLGIPEVHVREPTPPLEPVPTLAP